VLASAGRDDKRRTAAVTIFSPILFGTGFASLFPGRAHDSFAKKKTRFAAKFS
jgi:hypothetical protein